MARDPALINKSKQMAIHFTRAQLNQEIFFLTKKLSPEGEERMQLDKVARSFYKDLPEEISIKALTDTQAKTIYIALKSLESSFKMSITNPLVINLPEVEKPATDAQIGGIMKIIFDRYGRDYTAITTALKNYCPVIVAKLNLKEGKNIYLPNFYTEIKKSFDEANKLIKRFDAIRAQEKKRK